MKDPAPASDSAHATGLELAGKYLTFLLGKESYGLQILKVREIIGLMDITLVPKTPRSIRGVINLRGKIIPVVDLRMKFEMPKAEDTELTCIIVVDTVMEEQHTQMGILVDTVSEVLDIKPDQIEPAPCFGGGINTDFILAVAQIQDSVKVLLNIDDVLSNVDLTQIDAPSSSSAPAAAA